MTPVSRTVGYGASRGRPVRIPRGHRRADRCSGTAVGVGGSPVSRHHRDRRTVGGGEVVAAAPAEPTRRPPNGLDRLGRTFARRPRTGRAPTPGRHGVPAAADLRRDRARQSPGRVARARAGGGGSSAGTCRPRCRDMRSECCRSERRGGATDVLRESDAHRAGRAAGRRADVVARRRARDARSNRSLPTSPRPECRSCG